MVEKKTETTTEEKVEERYEHSQVPETMRDVIIDKKNNTVLSDVDILVAILNKIEKIERSVA